jgi:hypothetical protein
MTILDVVDERRISWVSGSAVTFLIIVVVLTAIIVFKAATDTSLRGGSMAYAGPIHARVMVLAYDESTTPRLYLCRLSDGSTAYFLPSELYQEAKP